MYQPKPVKCIICKEDHFNADWLVAVNQKLGYTVYKDNQGNYFVYVCQHDGGKQNG